MTAVVGILNKQAVAIAADSAVTIGGTNGHKIFNKANKIFTVSKRHPVGIMIYNSASFMTTPWETIIKVYRQQLNNKSLPTVKEYQEDFIEFLRSRKFYSDPEMQLSYLENFATTIINTIVEDIAKNHKHLFENPTTENREQILKLFENQLENLINYWMSQPECCTEFKDYSFEKFKQYSIDVFKNTIDVLFIQNGFKISDQLIEKINEAVYAILRSKEQVTSFTGLIFTGFGEDQIYPQLIPVNISMVVDNRLRYYIDENQSASISNANHAAVCPFAQTDVINTILTGVDPNLDQIYLSNFDEVLKKYNQEILKNIDETNKLLYEQIKNLDTNVILQQFNNLNREIKRENYILPLINAVSNLAKDDLAEMAESLIYLTYLKRRITFAEESVGGPVDVAVISKGDGFVWIKRKHYFRPELNPHFFDNYFK